MSKKFAPLSPTALAVLDALKTLPEGATLADLKAIMPEANPAHLNALRARGLVDATQVEIETVRVVKSKVNRYTVKAE